MQVKHMGNVKQRPRDTTVGVKLRHYESAYIQIAIICNCTLKCDETSFSS